MTNHKIWAILNKSNKNGVDLVRSTSFFLPRRGSGERKEMIV
nr:MAG TPA_asm: hypothetical protein [Microviridae sp.]